MKSADKTLSPEYMNSTLCACVLFRGFSRHAESSLCPQVTVSRGRTVGKKVVSRSTEAGLQFPVGRIARLIKAAEFASRTGAGAYSGILGCRSGISCCRGETVGVFLILFSSSAFCILVRSGECTVGKVFSNKG